MAQKTEKLAAFQESIIKEYKIVGSSMAVFSAGQTIIEHHTGYADRKTKRKTNNNTFYHWASVTKTFTAIAIMQLRDQGMLKLDDPIVKYVPELNNMDNPYGSMEDITIFHILSHSSGFRCDTWLVDIGKGGTWNDLMKTMPNFKILFKPGSKFSYSNLAINFLGKAIERISGLKYETYIKKHIFTPLGMSTAYLGLTPKKLLPYRSNNYSIKNGKIFTNGFEIDTGVTTANGGLNASIVDMSKYVNFLSQGGTILKRNSLEEMWNIQLPIGKELGVTTYIGLGFFILKRKHKVFVGHTGSQRGYICCMYVNANNKTGVLININTSGKNKNPDTRKGMYELRKRVFDAI